MKHCRLGGIVPDLGLGVVVDGVGGLDLEEDGLSGDGLDEKFACHHRDGERGGGLTASGNCNPKE